MAVKDGFGEDGFEIWDAWSRQSDAYVERDARDVWKSIKPGRGITLATLFHEAKVNGWRDDGARPTPEDLEAGRRESAKRAVRQKAEEARERVQAASKAAQIWEAASTRADNHAQVRDPVTKLVKDKKSGTMEEVVDEGVQDKRLLVIEPEFAAVTRVVARQGNNLTSTIREAWDIGNLSTLTRHDPITATGAHIAIIGHVTADELRAELTHTDTANGFANRFLFLCVKRSKCLPFGGEDLPESVVTDFARRLERAGSAARRVGRVKMTEAARRDWERVYPRLSEAMPGLFGAATARAEAQVVRLAMIYALLDEKAQIDVPHLLAALAVWEYAEASALQVFGESLGDPVADGILRAVRAAGKDGMTRTQISGLFHRNYPAGRIEAALDLLARLNLAKKDPKDTGGRPSEVWVRP